MVRYREQYGRRYKVYKHVNMLMDGYRTDIREKAEEEKSATNEEEAQSKHAEVLVLWKESKDVSWGWGWGRKGNPPPHHRLVW